MGVAVGRTDAATGVTEGSKVVGTSVSLAFAHPARRRKTSKEGKAILI